VQKIFHKKSVEAKQQFQFYSEFAKVIPSVATLKGKTLTKENLASIKPTTQEARNFQF
jgi:hypothetical protein